MTPHFCIGQMLGKPTSWIEYFPILTNEPGRDRPSVIATERYELTPEQSKLSIDKLKKLVERGELKRIEARA